MADDNWFVWVVMIDCHDDRADCVAVARTRAGAEKALADYARERIEVENQSREISEKYAREHGTPEWLKDIDYTQHAIPKDDDEAVQLYFEKITQDDYSIEQVEFVNE